jgi:hypothetical protein
MKEPNLHKTPKDNMIDTFQTIWKHASQAEKDFITKIWASIIKPAEILKWAPTAKKNEYHLELKHEVSGSHQDVPFGKIVLKKKMAILFSEEKISGINTFRQVISFSDNGFCFRMGFTCYQKILL